MMAATPVETDAGGDSVTVRFRDAMGQVAAPVCVVTILDDAHPYGTTVSAFMSLSMAPPMLLLSLDNTSRLLSRISFGSRLGVNILATDQQALASRFASKIDDKFDGVDWFLDADAPRFDSVHAWVCLDVREIIAGGDHRVILGEVVAAEALEGFQPLTYHRRTFGTHAAL
ncbi:flavin reductase family protein [Longivirga aurantiaca]|uniref:Flavin reductase family protein n=1 Tax=Longivirga aurantiaca TaxID=1837743 RepID=A0ABW1T5V5_9ACTN